MSELRRLKKLYKKIPTFTCIAGCTDCCGPVTFSNLEWDQVQDQRKAAGLNCPYSLNGCCDIYEHRPMLCRLFGSVDTERLRCPHGRQPDRPLTEKQGSDLMDEYLARFHE